MVASSGLGGDSVNARGGEVTMSDARATCFASGTAAKVCERFPIGTEARALIREGMSPEEFLDVLIENGELVDAVQFLAHALPRREAVWWACRAAFGTVSDGREEAALRAAEAWVVEPVEDNRIVAQGAAETAGYDTPAGCAAAAAAWSGGSLAPPGAPVVPPGEQLTAHGAAAAVMLAVVRGPAEAIPEAYRSLLIQGLAIARGEELWPEPSPPVRSAATPVSPLLPEAGLPPAGLKQPIRWE
jgi:hypothetical protein